MTTATANKARVLAVALTTALATTALAGCTGKVAPASASSAAKAEELLAKGKSAKAVTHAEAAVLAAPRDAATRLILAKAYVEAGRFASASTTFEEAMALGDISARTVLVYSLTLSAQGRFDEAQALLDRHEHSLDPADFGLAITLAGRPQRGIQVLSNAIRSGANTVQVRQNLAYAFAMDGDWRSARLLAQQDLARDTLAQRMGEWAVMSQPQNAPQRVATMLGTTPVADMGQPAELALANFPSASQLAFETGDTSPVALATSDYTGAELAPVEMAPAEPVDLAHSFDVVEPAPVAVSRQTAAPRVTLPRPTPSYEPSARPTVRDVAVAKLQPGSTERAFDAAFVRTPGAYSVQLGSFQSLAIANEAWGRFQKRYPGLKGASKVVTKARVDGKIYYRVAASGFAKNSAATMCGMVKQKGGGCFAYASSRTLPGTIADAPRVAQR